MSTGHLINLFFNQINTSIYNLSFIFIHQLPGIPCFTKLLISGYIRPQETQALAERADHAHRRQSKFTDRLGVWSRDRPDAPGRQGRQKHSS